MCQSYKTNPREISVHPEQRTYTYLNIGCGHTDNLMPPIFSELCDPNKEVTSCLGFRFTPDILQQFSHVF